MRGCPIPATAQGEAHQPIVVAVAGGVGSGKTTLAQALGRQWGATVLHFDDYEQITARSPADMARWIEAGAPLDELVVEGLPQVLASLKAGQAVRGHDGAWLQPTPCVVLETQLGRQHTATGQYVDALFWLEVPADVALARKVQQLAGLVRPGEAPRFLGWLQQYLSHYQAMVAPLLQKQRQTVAPEADATLDALQAPAYLLDQALQWLALHCTLDFTQGAST